MLTAIYFIGYIIMLGIAICIIKFQAKEDVTVGLFITMLFVAGLSWFGILISGLLYLCEVISAMDIMNKKLF